MNKTLLLTAALAPAFLAACGALADLERGGTESQRLATVHQGLDGAEVRDIAGAPDFMTSRGQGGGELWVYRAQDAMQEPTEYDIAFGADGRVARISALQQEDPG